MDFCVILVIFIFVKLGLEENCLKYCFVFKKIVCDGFEMDYSLLWLIFFISF